MDVLKQVEYWRSGSNEDFEVAGELLEKGRFRQALFFAHLALEKMLKAHVTKETSNVPPRTHKLERLATIANLHLTGGQLDFLLVFGSYQLEGRYPDAVDPPLDRETAYAKFGQAEEMVKWLRTLL